MMGFDTNLLVRYLVRDDADHAVVVDKIIAQTVAHEDVVFLNTIVVCETVWVLDAGYGYSQEEIADAVEKLLLTQQFEFEARDLVWRALGRFRTGRADVSDYLIGEINVSNGCDRTATFDRGLRGEDGFEFLAV